MARARPKQADGSPLYSFEEVAARLGMCAKTVRRHADEGRLPYILRGARTRLCSDEDIRALEANLRRLAAEDQKRRQDKRKPNQGKPACRSTNRRARASGTTTSSSVVVAFTDLQRQRAGQTRAK
ncbi:helix-turn-helix domain-containing protein [Novispirillum sp. DQ9]|uniref:helix-turn-helix domain-containing protein n=1 Tax=Novispirillum sp. DQ9 TaxID=3398612 RepID=UPI003C7D3114